MKTLKQLTVLILFLSGLMTTGCDRKENAPPPEPPTINVTDSLVMVDLALVDYTVANLTL